MLNNNETTTVFNPEQTTQINEYIVRLSNIESEISIAQKNLKAIKSESERAIKDKQYQEELHGEVVNKVTSMRVQANELETKIEESIEILNKLREEVKFESIDHESKTTELKNRELVISKKETELCNKEIALNNAIKILNEEKAVHAEKVTKLKELSTIL